MTGWDVYGGRASVPAGMLAELAALRAAQPGYDVILTSHSPAYRFEAIRRDPGPGPWCVVSTDPAGLWRELAGRAPPARGKNRAGRLLSSRSPPGLRLGGRRAQTSPAGARPAPTMPTCVRSVVIGAP